MKKSKVSLAVLKYDALRLRKKFQLPYKLTYYIMQLTKESDVNWVNYLIHQSEHMLHIPKYYKKYPDIERECNEIIESDYKKFMGEI